MVSTCLVSSTIQIKIQCYDHKTLKNPIVISIYSIIEVIAYKYEKVWLETKAKIKTKQNK